MRRSLAALWSSAALAVTVLGACLVALYWVFLVPIYQSPDEIVLIDYIFSVHQAGHLFTARDGPGATSHPWTDYLARATGAERIAFHYNVKAAPGYGTAEFFRKLEAGAPPAVLEHNIPYLVTRYPFGYYAAEALWLDAVGLVGSGPVTLFFGARIFNVLLLAVSLVCSYGVLRELGLPRVRSLLLTAAIGFFPMVTFISSYNQPDNLGLTLVSLAAYLALRLRRGLAAGPTRVALGLAAGIGLALGLLLVTKYQFWLCAAVPIAGLLLSEHLFRRLPRRPWLPALALLILPTLASFTVQYWINFGSDHPLVVHTHTAIAWTDVALREAQAQGATAVVFYLLNDLAAAFKNFYVGGDTFRSFWGVFGWMDTPLVIGNDKVQAGVRYLVQALTLVVLAMTLFRIENVATRLVLLARRGRWRWALRILFSNPLVNGLFAFTAFMFVFYVYTHDSFYAQGRNWLPFVLPIFLVATGYAPRALTHPAVQRGVGTLLLLLLVGYSAVAAWYAIPTLRARYYDNGRALVQVPLGSLTRDPRDDLPHAIDYLDGGAQTTFRVDPSQPGDLGTTTTVAIGGWAIDRSAGAPVTTVFVTVDGERDYEAVYGDSRPDIAAQFGPQYLKTGFDLILPTAGMTPGRHTLTLKIVAHDRSRYEEPADRVNFEVAV